MMIVIGLVYLYWLWRKLGKEYSSGVMVSFGWVSVLAFGFGSWLAGKLVMAEGANFWGGYVALLMASYLFCLKNDLKYWAFLEDGLFIFLPVMVVLNLIFKNWLISGLILLTILLSWLVRNRYRSLVWYKSGKKGFLFFWSNFWFFMFRFAVDRQWLSAGLGLIFGLGLFILGELFRLKKNDKK